MALEAEHVIARQLQHLPVGRLGQPLVVEAERHRPETGHTLDEAPALVVDNVDPVAARDDQRPLGGVLHQVGHGVQHEGPVAGARGVR